MVVQYVVVCLAALLGGAAALLSGFGLNAILLPVFMLCFPQPVAFTGFAVVQLFDDLVKAALLVSKVDWLCVIVFGLPAAIGGILAGGIIGHLARPLYRYSLMGHPHLVTLPDVVIAGLLLSAAILPLVRVSERLSVDARFQPVAGALVGVLGGISGHYGALRGAFLVNTGLTRDAFIATSVFAALALDASRVSVYGLTSILPAMSGIPQGSVPILAAASLSAALGSWLAVRWRKSFSLRDIHVIVGIVIILSAIVLGTGLT